jgi:hypothetical protein
MKLRKILIRFISLAGLLFLAVSFVTPAQAKEIWLNPVEAGKKGVGNWGGVKFKKKVHFQWRVPDDFDTVTPQSGSATLLVIGLKDKELNYQVNVNVAIGGDLNDVNPLTTVGALPIPLTAGTLTEIPLVGVLPNLTPGEYVTLNFERGKKNKAKLLVVGIRYDYASTVVSPADIAALQADIAALQTANTTQDSAITTLQTEQGTQNTSIASLLTVNGTQTTDITALQTASTTQDSAITTLQTEQGTQNTSIASLLTVNGTQTTDITALQTANTTQDSAITAIQTEQGTQNTSIASLLTVNGTQTSDITTLQTANTTQDSAITAIQTEQGTQNGSISTLQANVSTLQTDTGTLLTAFAGVSRTGDDIFFDGVNVHIQDGSGATDGLPGAGAGTPNGLGNLIVGYDEDRTTGSDKTGSHNLVVGEQHNYPSYGGLVAGFQNTVSGTNASVSGGRSNTASGINSSVSGGTTSTASGDWSSISGGYNNTSSGNTSSISGGSSNTASGYFSSVSGGFDNEASGNWSSISGGSFGSATGIDDWVAGGLFEDE